MASMSGLMEQHIAHRGNTSELLAPSTSTSTASSSSSSSSMAAPRLRYSYSSPAETMHTQASRKHSIEQAQSALEDGVLELIKSSSGSLASLMADVSVSEDAVKGRRLSAGTMSQDELGDSDGWVFDIRLRCSFSDRRSHYSRSHTYLATQHMDITRTAMADDQSIRPRPKSHLELEQLPELQRHISSHPRRQPRRSRPLLPFNHPTHERAPAQDPVDSCCGVCAVRLVERADARGGADGTAVAGWKQRSKVQEQSCACRCWIQATFTSASRQEALAIGHPE